jgi:hypothetical protein
MRKAIFYLPAGGDPAELAQMMAPGTPGRAAIERAQATRVIADGGGPPRSGLAEALELIAAAEAGLLVVARLWDVASSLGELVRLLGWLEQAGADLIAADVGFDSGQAGASQTVALLREVEGWDREPHPTRRPRGRPGLSAADPELARRLSALRERGLSLQAIAAALNDEGVPTPRGGAEWRPSSVQAALGYRRPRPPAPGAPPAPPPRPGGLGHRPGRPSHRHKPGPPPPPRHRERPA